MQACASEIHFHKIHWISIHPLVKLGFPCGSIGKESTCNAGDLGSIPGLGRSPGEAKSYPLQYSGLENFMDYIVHGVSKSWIWLSDFHSTCQIGVRLSVNNTLSLFLSVSTAIVLSAKPSRYAANLEGWGGEGVGGMVVQDVGTHVHLWLIHVDAWQKPPWYCN